MSATSGAPLSAADGAELADAGVAAGCTTSGRDFAGVVDGLAAGVVGGAASAAALHDNSTDASKRERVDMEVNRTTLFSIMRQAQEKECYGIQSFLFREKMA